MIVLKHYIITLFWVLGNIGIAYISAKILQNYFSEYITEKKISIFLLIGLAIILTAGLGKLGWEIQTMSGTSPQESLNKIVFKIFSHIGTYILFTDLFIKYLQIGRASLYI
jgi:hypothetical protein